MKAMMSNDDLMSQLIKIEGPMLPSINHPIKMRNWPCCQAGLFRIM
jgi:hypothetical protein